MVHVILIFSTLNAYQIITSYKCFYVKLVLLFNVQKKYFKVISSMFGWGIFHKSHPYFTSSLNMDRYSFPIIILKNANFCFLCPFCIQISQFCFFEKKYMDYYLQSMITYFFCKVIVLSNAKMHFGIFLNRISK